MSKAATKRGIRSNVWGIWNVWSIGWPLLRPKRRLKSLEIIWNPPDLMHTQHYKRLIQFNSHLQLVYHCKANKRADCLATGFIIDYFRSLLHLRRPQRSESVLGNLSKFLHKNLWKLYDELFRSHSTSWIGTRSFVLCEMATMCWAFSSPWFMRLSRRGGRLKACKLTI